MAEVDISYEEFLRAWKPRLGLKDRHIAEGYMRASNPQLACEGDPDEAVLIPGMTLVQVVLPEADAHISAYWHPGVIGEMLAEWEHQLAARPDMEPRSLTRRLLAEHLALRLFDGDSTPMLLCGAVWLACSSEAGEQFRPLFEEGGFGMRCEITHEGGRRRGRVYLLGYAVDGDSA